MTAAQPREFMARALRLAAKGLYTTDPNPRVGCVIVNNGEIVGEGWHEKAGGPHAEIHALKKAGSKAKGASVYVTLEPCCHFGKTAPCSDALIQAKVAKVVAATLDPNPLVAGEGMQKLAQAGIAIEQGLLQSEAQALNSGFIQRMLHKRPYIRTKIAMSLDGRTAMANGESQWITSSEARMDVHRLRARSSAVLTGINTVLADNPSLNARLTNVDIKQPLRVVLDSDLRMPPDAKMLTLDGETLIFTCNRDQKAIRRLQNAGAEVMSVAKSDSGIDLYEVLAHLAEKEINEVMVEAGANLNGQLLKHQLIDELVIYMAPTIMGDAARGLFHLPWISAMKDKINLEIKDVRAVGCDWRITANVKANNN
ncbi:bifunctional diaminohydroxyphosphoribosylaminopyrimidine deaminase/5-amino-6-(5-phosphoribosylamino)uracil reductase RibD [Kaarinaea lacus]